MMANTVLMCSYVVFNLIFCLQEVAGQPLEETVTIGAVFDDKQTIVDIKAELNESISDSSGVFYHDNVTLRFVNGTAASQDVVNTLRTVCQAVSKQSPHIFFTGAQCDASHIPASLFSHRGIPTVTLTDTECLNPSAERDHLYDLQITVGRSPLLEVLSFLIQSQRWTKLIIYYDAGDGAELTDVLLGHISDLNVTVEVFEFSSHTPNQNLQNLKYSKSVGGEYFPHIVLTSQMLTGDILKQAVGLNMRAKDYQWVLQGTGYNEEFILPFLRDQDNIAVLTQGGDEAIKQQASVTMQSALESTRLTMVDLQASGKWGERPTSWESPPGSARSPCSSAVPATLRQSIALGIKDNLPEVPPPDEPYPEYHILSSVARSQIGPQLEEVGSWTSDKQLEMKNNLFPNSFNGYNNRTFIVSCLEYSFFQIKEYQPDGSVKWVGLTFTLLDELALVLNFSYVVVEPRDGLWGIVDENGQWNGMIFEVINKSVDFAAGSFSITPERETVIDFAQPYFYDTSVVIIKQAKEQDKIDLYLKPYSWQVWLCIIAAMTIYGFLLWFVTLKSPYYQGKEAFKLKDFDQGAIQLRNAIFYFYGCLVQQGGVWMPKSQSGRVLVGVFWFYTIVIVATYTGNLIAFLAVSTVNLPFDTLAQMAKQTALDYGVVEGVAMLMFLRGSTNEPFQSVYDGLSQPNPGSYGEAMARVKQGDFGFLAERSYYLEELSKDCSLAIIKETFYPTSYAWAFQPDSPHLPLFNEKISKMRETGLLTKWTKEWIPKSLNCTGLAPVTNAKVVSLSEFQGALYVLVGGILIGAIFLIVEQIVSYKLGDLSLPSILEPLITQRPSDCESRTETELDDEGFEELDGYFPTIRDQDELNGKRLTFKAVRDEGRDGRSSHFKAVRDPDDYNSSNFTSIRREHSMTYLPGAEGHASMPGFVPIRIDMIEAGYVPDLKKIRGKKD